MIEIERKQCILCGICEALAPHIFKQTSIVEVDQQASEQDWMKTALCIEACPMSCIKERPD